MSLSKMSQLVACFAIVLVSTFVGGRAHGSNIVVVSDGFSGTDGATLNGRTPDGINLPGGTWSSENLPPTFPDFTIAGNTAQSSVNSSAFISIQSAGLYVKPASLTISGDIKVGNTPGNTLGVGLAFNSAPTGNYNASDRITLAINGQLNFNQTLIATYSAANFGGNSFDPTSFYHLSFDVNTVTGSISDIVLSKAGQGSENYASTYSVVSSAYAGIFANAAAYGVNGNVDNFSITTTPEPSSFVLLGVAGAALVAHRRSRKS